MSRRPPSVLLALLFAISYDVAALPLPTCAFVASSRRKWAGLATADGACGLGRFRRRKAATMITSPSVLCAALGDDNDTDKDDVSEEPQNNQPRGDEADRRYGDMLKEQDDDSAASKEKGPVYLFFDAVEMIFSYSFQFLGNLLFLGIFLNLAGWGYYFDSNKGLHFDTIANMREMRQFHDAAKNMKPRVETRPSSSLPE